MTAVPPTNAAEQWLDEGRRAAAVLNDVGSAVVIGRDVDAAAWVALGLAEAHAAARRVAVGDLVGELAPLQRLVRPDSDPHGISDSFLFGVSLNKIAQPVDETGNLFVLPSGSEEVATEAVFRSERWRRLASGFREVGALLLLVAHADTPGLDDLAASVDGVIVVGDASGALADAPPPLAVIAPARRRPQRGAADQPTEELVAEAPRRPRPPVVPTTGGGRSWRRYGIVALLALTVAVALAYYLLPRSTSRHGDVPPGARGDSAGLLARRDSTRAPNDSARHGPDTLAALVVENPGDSLAAAGYSVLLSGADTPEGATTLEARDQQFVPVVALTPLLQDGAPYYRLFVGAYPTAAEAESLRTALRRRAVVGDSAGLITRTPYALLVADRVPATEVAGRVAELARRKVRVYPLSRGDGTVALYAGAFETPDQAAWLARELRAAGLSPTLVYRTGRSL